MKITIGIGGASGSIYAKTLLDTLVSIPGHEVNLVFSENALVNWKLEIPDKDLESYPFPKFSLRDFNAPFASGSAKWDAMIICPCSAGLLGRIANGVSDDLMSRAADVMLKERKKLILIFRETPLHLIHIDNMKKVTLAGGIVCPAIPSFYSQPVQLEDIARTVTDRALHLAGIDVPSFQWGSQS